MDTQHIALEQARSDGRNLPEHHRSATGGGPGGVWWVAWRQHRWAVTTALAIAVLVAGALVAFRFALAARLHAAGCTLTDPDSCSGKGMAIWWDSAGLRQWWTILHGAVLAAPIVLGAFLAAPIFPREFEQRTHVLALTQSVNLRHWWAAKITVVGVPLVVALLGLGLLTQWVDDSFWVTGPSPLANINFGVRSIVPAAFGLLALSISATAGIAIRSTTAAVVTALVVAGLAMILLLIPLRPHLLPATRDVTPIADASGGTGIAVYSGTPDPSDWYLGSGYLDADGNELTVDLNTCYATWANAHPNDNNGDSSQQTDRAADLVACARRQGVAAQYTDYLPGSVIWPMRGVVAAICAALSALVLAAGSRRLRAATARR